MTRLIVIAAAIACVLASAGSAQELDPCSSVQWTSHPALFDIDEYLQEMASIDYDEDGTLDLVGIASKRGEYWHNLVWWKGEGGGAFRRQAPTSVRAGLDARFSNIVIADATGDGLPDLVTALDGGNENPPRLVILPATGSGRGPALIKTLSRAGFLTAIQLDDDPAVELVLRSYDQRVDVYDDIAATPTLAGSIETEMTPTDIQGADFDRDGNLDLAVTMREFDNEPVLHLYYGRAGGTFETPVALPSIRPDPLAVGDLNEDGRPDLVAGNVDGAATVSIYLNEGDRKFLATGISLPRLGPYGVWETILLEDVSGDGHLDLIAGQIATAVGRGDGTFFTPTVGSLRYSSHIRVAGDFDGDGKLELVMGYTELSVATTTCATQVSLGTPTSIRSKSAFTLAITHGQPLDLRVEISGFGPSRGHGSVILHDGATVLDAAPAGADGTAAFIVPDLANGQHLLTSEFTGNKTVPAATSDTLEQWVTDPTPVTIQLPGTLPAYGEPLPIQVTGASGGRWPFTLDIDGASQYLWTNDPINVLLEPASHTVSAKFEGWFAAAPGQSPPITFTISKSTPVLELNSLSSLRESVQALSFSVRGSGAVGPSGSVQLIEGTTTIAGGALVNGSAILNVALPRGIHDVRAVYPGDARYRDVIRNLRFEVLPNLPFPIEAHAMADGIRIAYILPATAIKSTLQLFRRLAGTTNWEIVPGWNPDTGMDASVPRRGVPYEYRLYVGHTNAYRSFSNIDSAALPSRRRAVSPP